MTAPPNRPAPSGALRRLVFIAMPFGKKRDARQAYEIDFDRIYEIGIKPAFERFAIEYIRSDEERGGGLIHLQMFERLLLADIAVVDVTTENANVFYELGVRHAARPRSTIILSAGEAALPFDISMMRAIVYKLDTGVLSERAGADLAQAIAERLETALSDRAVTDSPLFELIPHYPGITLPSGVLQTFRDREHHLDQFRQRLLAARRKKGGFAEVVAVETEIGEMNEATSELLTDLVMSYRDFATTESYDRLIALVERTPATLRDRSIAVRQQYALALNRRNKEGDRHRAIDVLEALCAQQGDTSETCGILGRIYKDLYTDALHEGSTIRARGHLLAAIDCYRRGFNADPRDFYPGVNMITLLTMEGSDESIAERQRVLPAVAFSVERRDAATKNDYWTIATLLELSIHGNDWPNAHKALTRMFALPRTDETPFRLQSTAAQLVLLRRYEPRGVDLAQLDAILLQVLLSLPPASAAVVVPTLTKAAYADYRAAQSKAALAELDAAIAKLLVTLSPGAVGSLLSMISDDAARGYGAVLSPQEVRALEATLDPDDFAKLGVRA